MPNYREALTSDEKAQELTGFNMYDDPLDERVICVCGWQGTRGQLLTATGLKSDVEFIYCPICGSDDVGEL